MNEKKVTFLLIPQNKSKMTEFSISDKKLKLVLFGSAFALILLTLAGFHYLRSINLKKQQDQIVSQNMILRETVQSNIVKLHQMSKFIQWATQFSQRIRVISNLKNSPSTALPELSSVSNTLEQSSSSSVEEDIEDTRLALLGVEKEFYLLQESLANKKTFLSALPTRKPADGYFTSGFGVRSSPHGGSDKMHEGVDVANRYGTPIKATAKGIVKFAGRKGGYGRIVIIDHGYGLETWYAHCWKLLVKKSQKVRRGQKIALMGSSGRSTGSHVHYEVRVNKIPVDPLTYILEE